MHDLFQRVYQRGPSRPARADKFIQPLRIPSVSKRPFPASQSTAGTEADQTLECIKEALPGQPERNIARARPCSGVYQRGPSRPARAAMELTRSFARRSVSKWPFPANQTPNKSPAHPPTQVYQRGPSRPARAEQVTTHPPCRVYQRGPSRPARAAKPSVTPLIVSVSKRPFPASQSRTGHHPSAYAECIKEALPGQPERRSRA